MDLACPVKNCFSKSNPFSNSGPLSLPDKGKEFEEIISEDILSKSREAAMDLKFFRDEGCDH